MDDISKFIINPDFRDIILKKAKSVTSKVEFILDENDERLHAAKQIHSYFDWLALHERKWTVEYFPNSVFWDEATNSVIKEILKHYYILEK